jgi:Dolichyl-phosphate-mannose-protein mannosyltransferase
LLPTAEIHCSSPFLARDGTLLYSGEVDSANTLPQATVAPSAVRKSFFSSIWFIVFIALALRLLVITIGHTYRITPRRDHFQFGWEMGRLARSIAEGHGFSSPTDLDSGPSAWTAPIYPYILAGIFKIFGIYSNASAWVILAFNSVFASLTCWTIFRVSERIFGLSVARGAAWTWAVFPYLIYWPVRVVWEASFSTFLLTLALWMAISIVDSCAPVRVWILFGLLWGLIAMTNTALVILLPFMLLWMLLLLPRDSSRYSGAAAFTLTFVMCLVPWTIRNCAVFGRFIFIRDNLPLELYEANNPSSSGLWTRGEHPGNDPATMRRFQELGEIGFMDEKKQQLKDFVRKNPGEFLRFSLERVWYFWAAPPQATIARGYDLRTSRHVQFLLAAIFAFAGLILAFVENDVYAWLLAPFLLIYPLPYYLVNPFPRYKHPVEPVMLILIVCTLVQANKIRLGSGTKGA